MAIRILNIGAFTSLIISGLLLTGTVWFYFFFNIKNSIKYMKRYKILNKEILINETILLKDK